MTDIADWTAEQLTDAYARRALSPLEALQAVTERIARDNAEINAFAVLDPRALAAAGESTERWQAGRALGPLDGVPCTIKDLIDIAGLPTRRGSRTTSAADATEDAPVVSSLKAAGRRDRWQDDDDGVRLEIARRLPPARHHAQSPPQAAHARRLLLGGGRGGGGRVRAAACRD